jgi:hypothetical protein
VKTLYEYHAEIGICGAGCLFITLDLVLFFFKNSKPNKRSWFPPTTSPPISLIPINHSLYSKFYHDGNLSGKKIRMCYIIKKRLESNRSISKDWIE